MNDSSNFQAIRNRLITNQTFKIVHKEPWFWKCSLSKSSKPLIYDTSNREKRIVKRYNTNNQFTKDAYNEVIEEINNILNEEFVKTPPYISKQNCMNSTPPPLTRQNCFPSELYD